MQSLHSSLMKHLFHKNDETFYCRCMNSEHPVAQLGSRYFIGRKLQPKAYFSSHAQVEPTACSDQTLLSCIIYSFSRKQEMASMPTMNALWVRDSGKP